MTKLGARVILVLALALVAGCKRDKSVEPPPAPAPGSGTAAVAPPPVVARPSQAPLAKLEELASPDDPQRTERIALGHALFFDERLSVDGTLACYSCHQDDHGNGGADPLAIGAGGKPLTRHSPVIWNVAYLDKVGALYWDGRAKDLVGLTKAAWGGANMGVGTEPAKLEAKAAQIAKLPGYAPLLAAAFPGVRKITAEHLASALADYQRTLVCKDTAYDRFAGGDRAALTEPQQRGLDVFMGKGQCVVCHAPPWFSTAMAADGGFYANVGIGTARPEAEVDVGRFKITQQAADWAAFKVPSLRNVARSAPYFHDGSVATLEDAVKLMVAGGIANKAISPLLRDNGLSTDEVGDLIAFLGSLDCPTGIAPPASPPK